MTDLYYDDTDFGPLDPCETCNTRTERHDPDCPEYDPASGPIEEIKLDEQLYDVYYTVPVIARVNVETKQVERVTVADEVIQLEVDEAGVPKVVRYGEGKPGAEESRQATIVAETQEWPAWEHGW